MCDVRVQGWLVSVGDSLRMLQKIEGPGDEVKLSTINLLFRLTDLLQHNMREKSPTLTLTALNLKHHTHE